MRELQRLAEMSVPKKRLNIILDAVDKGTSKQSTDCAYARILDYVRCEIPLVTTTGSDLKWSLYDPRKLFQHFCSLAPLQQLLAAALNKHETSPDRPWSLILAFDELTPGSKLQPHNDKKCMNLYFSFRQFGARALQGG